MARLLPVVIASVLTVLLPPPVRAQAPTAFPTATTLAALTTYPAFFHLKAVAVRGRIVVKDGQARLVPENGEGRGVDLLFRGDAPAEGAAEVRGQFWDVGELAQDDPHASTLGLPDFVRARLGDRWPAHGELPVVSFSSAIPIPPPSSKPSLRLLSLDPGRYDGQTVTVAGQFAGLNLLGDLPQSPRVSRADFVIRNAGGAVWVTGVAPRGRGWQLDLTNRADTDDWLQVEGVVHSGNGLVWIAAKSLAQAKGAASDAAASDAPDVPMPATLQAPPPDVVFTLPAQDETDVAPGSPVKIQTSRDLDPASLDRHIAVSYVGQAPGQPGIPFHASFDRGNRVLQLTFDQPLERFRTVVVKLDGITGTDGQPMKTFTLSFSVGG